MSTYKALHAEGETWLVYDAAQRFVVAVDETALRARVEALAGEVEHLDILADDARLLEWARAGGYAQSWEGARLAEVGAEPGETRELERAGEA